MLYFQIIFEFNWNIRNTVTFDSQVGVRNYIVKLKGLHFVAIESVKEVTKSRHEERQLSKVTYMCRLGLSS